MQPLICRLELQGSTGTDTRADAAVDAAQGIDADFSRGPVDSQPLALQPELGGIKFVNVAGELHHHGAELVGRHLSPQNLGGHIKVHGEPIGDRLVNRLSGEMEGEAPFHRERPAERKLASPSNGTGVQPRSAPARVPASLGWPNQMFPPTDSTADASAKATLPSGEPVTAASLAPGPSPGGLGRRERMVLAAVAALLAVLLFWVRGGLHPAAPLERLARQSPDLATALTNGRPTLVEFYADWCEACRAMAPAMEAIEQRRRGALDVVLLNVDNPRWQPELDRYAVNGIPQLELFDAAGRSVGRSIGARRPEELEALTTALVEGKPLPQLVGVGATSGLTEARVTSSAPSASEIPPSPIADSALPRQSSRPAAIGPRSHG